MVWLMILAFYYAVSLIVAALIDLMFIRLFVGTIPFKLCLIANLIMTLIATALNTETWFIYADAASLTLVEEGGIHFVLLLLMSICIITTLKYIFYSRHFIQRRVKLWSITLLSALAFYGIVLLYGLYIS
jgi:hypothetical protein